MRLPEIRVFANDERVRIISAVCAALVVAAASVLIGWSIACSARCNALRKLEIGETFFFGEYEQDNDETNGKEKIEWRVLEKRNGQILVLSTYALDSQPYNTQSAEVTWEECTLRSWLNDTFYTSAFSPVEKKLIEEKKTVNFSYVLFEPPYRTYDKVFLLCPSEIGVYCPDMEMSCRPTQYALANGAYANNDEGYCWWWLRTYKASSNQATSIHFYGDATSDFVNKEDGAVRPCMWIDLTR